MSSEWSCAFSGTPASSTGAGFLRRLRSANHPITIISTVPPTPPPTPPPIAAAFELESFTTGVGLAVRLGVGPDDDGLGKVEATEEVVLL